MAYVGLKSFNSIAEGRISAGVAEVTRQAQEEMTRKGLDPITGEPLHGPESPSP